MKKVKKDKNVDIARRKRKNLNSSSFTKKKKLYTIKELGNTKRKREIF